MRGGRGKCVTGRAGPRNGLMPLRDIAAELQVNVKTVRQDLAWALAKTKKQQRTPRIRPPGRPAGEKSMRHVPVVEGAELIANWQELVRQVLERDGFMVGWSNRPLQIGELYPEIEGCEMGQPFYVTGVATREDAVRQFMTGREMDPDAIQPPYGGFWYKLQTD
jgi:hypothetical protein